MGLDVSHGAWHGAYSAFSRWRTKLASLIGIPLDLMEGFYGSGFGEGTCAGRLGSPLHAKDAPKDKQFWIERDMSDVLPLRWESFKPDPLHVLLHHSDCDGEIAWEDCGPIADRLSELVLLLPDETDRGHIGNWRSKTQEFIDGCRLAFESKENLEFG